eukprot:3977678-Amphidinium_carterae.1
MDRPESGPRHWGRGALAEPAAAAAVPLRRWAHPPPGRAPKTIARWKIRRQDIEESEWSTEGEGGESVHLGPGRQESKEGVLHCLLDRHKERSAKHRRKEMRNMLKWEGPPLGQFQCARH